MKPFLVGQRVTWCGVEGVVDKIEKQEPSTHVYFDNGNTFWFTSDGRICSWHKEPSLFHVEDKVEFPTGGLDHSDADKFVIHKPTRKIEHWEHVWLNSRGELEKNYAVHPWSFMTVMLWEKKHDEQLPGKATHLRSTLIETFEVDDKCK